MEMNENYAENQFVTADTNLTSFTGDLQPNTIRFNSSYNEMIVEFRPDGVVEFGEAYRNNPDAAAQEFMRVAQDCWPEIVRKAHMARDEMPADFKGPYSEWLSLLRHHYPQSGTIEHMQLLSNPPINTADAYVNGELVSRWTEQPVRAPIGTGW